MSEHETPAATTGEAVCCGDHDEDGGRPCNGCPERAPVSSGEAGTGEAVGVAYLTVNQWCDDCGYHRSNGHQAECPHADPAPVVTPSAEGGE